MPNPLGLVVRGNLIYLVCTLWNYQDIRQLALHRVKSAVMTDVAVTRPADFDLDRYIEEQEFHYPVGQMIELKVKFDRRAAAHLFETPLSADQLIEDVNDVHVVVTATVRDTAQLAWWLLGFGEFTVVLEPRSARQNIERSQKVATQKYVSQ